MATKKGKEKFLMYKGRPLVRCGDTIYYGFNYEPYVIIMNIVTTKQVGDLTVADRVAIQLYNTDPSVRTRDRVVKKSEKKGLYAAMDIGTIWLERALAENAKQ